MSKSYDDKKYVSREDVCQACDGKSARYDLTYDGITLQVCDDCMSDFMYVYQYGNDEKLREWMRK